MIGDDIDRYSEGNHTRNLRSVISNGMDEKHMYNAAEE